MWWGGQNGWASKNFAVKKKQILQQQSLPIMASDWAAKLSGASASPERKPRKKDTEFNSREVMDYLHNNYNTYLTHAREDKEGEKYKVYKSLESPNQWTSKPKNGPKEVIRNRNGSNGTLDLLFEINRSVYQQRERNK